MIAIGCDHGGFDLKQAVIAYLEENHLAYKDFGCFGKESCDYPEFGKAAAMAVATGECDRGIEICTTAGIGGTNLALGIVDTFLNTAFPAEEKHCRRVAAIQALEAETMN